MSQIIILFYLIKYGCTSNTLACFCVAIKERVCWYWYTSTIDNWNCLEPISLLEIVVQNSAFWPCHIWPDRPYVQETKFIHQCSFYVLFMSCYYPPNAFLLGDVRCKYIPLRRKFSAGLGISPPDKILLYSAIYVGSILSSVTGP